MRRKPCGGLRLRCYSEVAMNNWENSDWFKNWEQLANNAGGARG